MAKYQNHLVDLPKFKVRRITGDEVKKACQQAKASVAGLDNWETAELGLICDIGYQWIADLLNMVEDGCPWPDGMDRARAAFLSKDPCRAACPLQYRV